MARLCVDAAESITWQSAQMPISIAAENVRLPTNEKTLNQSFALCSQTHAWCAEVCFYRNGLEQRARISATSNEHETYLDCIA